MCLPQVIESFQNYRGVATTFYPTLVVYLWWKTIQFLAVSYDWTEAIIIQEKGGQVIHNVTNLQMG
jgi:hypothetical protein